MSFRLKFRGWAGVHRYAFGRGAHVGGFSMRSGVPSRQSCPGAGKRLLGSQRGILLSVAFRGQLAADQVLVADFSSSHIAPPLFTGDT